MKIAPFAFLKQPLRLMACCLLLPLMIGCSSYGVIKNEAITEVVPGKGYSLFQWGDGQRSRDLSFMMTFSGGGTRAAALAYGVMQELRDNDIVIDGRSRTLLNEIDRISSVSGGSFTAAYYGLHGDAMFESFEDEVLRFDLEKQLKLGLFNPVRWFSTKGRTEMAVQYYQKAFFHGATYADMLREDHPIIGINASDLASGVRFSFIQEYFNLLCSDLSTFPIARAVAASSAVPAVFNPVVVENYSDCGNDAPDWLVKAREYGKDNAEIEMLTTGISGYLDKDRRKYIHFVDGGITDNMGMRALFDITELTGGIDRYMKMQYQLPPRQIVMIAVNASTDPVIDMDLSTKQPSMIETVSAMSNAQLHRYNIASIELIEDRLDVWSKQLSTPERPVTARLINIGFEDVADPQLRKFFNEVPTSFSLSDEQVDKLIEAGRQLLRTNPKFQDLLSDLEKL